jgi:hypothetical protein
MKFKILFQNIFYLTLKKHDLIFSCKHIVYILKDFKSHIEKIKHSLSIYILKFKNG